MPPKVSVIVPAYNAEKYLERCLNSIAIQTMPDFECIIVNDGSTDKTREIADYHANSDLRIRTFHQDNGGVSSARNYGLSRAIGEWIIFLDADDELPNDALETYSKFFSPDYDMLIGGYVVSNTRGEITYSVADRLEMQLDRNSAIKLMYEPLIYRYLGYIAGKCYRRSNIKKWELSFCTDIYFNEDRLFTTQYLCNSKKIFFFTKPVYNYYEHSESAMASLQKQFNPKFITDLKAFVEMKKTIGLSNCSKESLALANQGILRSYRTIKTQMHSFEINSLGLFFQLQKLLFKGLGLCRYFKFLMEVIFTKLGRL